MLMNDDEFPEDTCYICSKYFKHQRTSKINKSLGIKEVEIITSHSACRKLVKKREKLLGMLLEVEYDIFMLSC